MRYPFQFVYRVADEVKKSTNDPVSPLRYRYFDPGVITAALDNRRTTRSGSIGKFHPFGKHLEGSLCRKPLYSRMIDPLNFEARVEQMISKVAVIGQNHQAGRIPIESANGEVRSVVFCEVIGYRPSTFWVGESTDNTGGFVKEKYPLRGGGNDSTGDPHDRFGRIDASSEFSDDDIVDGDLPGGDELLGRAA